MYIPSSWYEPPVYKNQFGMDEFREEEFIVDTIEQFCKSALQKGSLSSKEDLLYMLLYEHIQDNLEQFVPEPDYDGDY